MAWCYGTRIKHASTVAYCRLDSKLSTKHQSYCFWFHENICIPISIDHVWETKKYQVCLKICPFLGKISCQFYFNQTIPTTGRQCRRPNDPRNGEVESKNGNQDSFDPDQKVWFKCDRGFKLDGHKDFECQDDGSWEPQPFPRCVPERE